jgi:hypothetical protein
MNNEYLLQHRAHAAMVAIETARTPMEKYNARQAGLAVKADLEKSLGDEAALAVFRKSQPRSMVGVWKAAELVHDRPIFMTGPAETRITRPVKLPDGTMATPNPQGQITVPLKFLDEMMARGYFRANSVITNLNTETPTPAHLNSVL